MCLTITVEIAGLDSRQLRGLAPAVSGDELDVAVQGPGLLRRHAPRLALHGCELLADEADWDAPTWAMTDQGTRRLAAFFERLFELASRDMSVSATWEGDQPDAENAISRSELLSMVSASSLGTKTRYLVAS